MSSDTTGKLDPIKRFLAIFFIVWAVVFVVWGVTSDGSARIVFLIAAVACLVVGGILARSFAFLQKKEF